jgi:hypothetical protein
VLQKKELTPLKMDSPDKFRGYIHKLWDELYRANFYYEILIEASKFCSEYKAANFSKVFWSYTLEAHYQTAMIYLHRIYDQNRESFNLHRFLITVRENQEIFDLANVRKRRENDPHVDELMQSIGKLDLAKLGGDIWYSSNENPEVKNLNKWRDRVTFHNDARELFKQKPFEEENPRPDIGKLIKVGFEILNRYSEYFDTTSCSEGCRDWKDMKFVFESLEYHPDVIRMRAE